MENTRDRLYCKECSSILEFRTDLWLRADELQTPSDRDALNFVKLTGILPHIVNQLLVKPRERRLRELISSQGTPISHIRNLEALMHESAYALCLESLPQVYVTTMTGPPNAFTFGSSENPVIVVDGRLVETMGSGELRALLGHEMGHIKNGHMLYHSLAQTLAQTVAVTASLRGFNMISVPMRLALLAWQRASEFSADRAALVACGSCEQVVSLFAKPNGIPVTSLREDMPFIDEVTKLFRTHPHLSERTRAVLEFSKTPEYVNISNQTNARRMFRLAFTPTCRFCGFSKAINATFCPTCGKSQV